MKSPGGASDLDDGEGGRSCGEVSRSKVGGWKGVANQDTNGADQMVADDPNGGDLDGDDRGVTGEEIRTESEDELIVPGRVFHAHLVHLCAELVG